MKMRSLHWNLTVWHPSAGPADPSGWPGLAHLAWAVRGRWYPVGLVTGGLLLAGGMALPSTAAFIAGMLVVASAVPDVGPRSATGSMVRTWSWLHSRRADRR